MCLSTFWVKLVFQWNIHNFFHHFWLKKFALATCTAKRGRPKGSKKPKVENLETDIEECHDDSVVMIDFSELRSVEISFQSKIDNEEKYIRQ